MEQAVLSLALPVRARHVVAILSFVGGLFFSDVRKAALEALCELEPADLLGHFDLVFSFCAADVRAPARPPSAAAHHLLECLRPAARELLHSPQHLGHLSASRRKSARRVVELSSDAALRGGAAMRGGPDAWMASGNCAGLQGRCGPPPCSPPFAAPSQLPPRDHSQSTLLVQLPPELLLTSQDYLGLHCKRTMSCTCSAFRAALLPSLRAPDVWVKGTDAT